MAEPLPPTTPTGDTHDPSPPKETSPTFHPFPKLPTEIRLAIWKHACFPRSQIDHGIHYVTASKVYEDEEEYLVADDDDLERFVDEEEFYLESDDCGYITLTAPKRPGDKHASAQRSSKRHNASACLWDAGLWTACRESKLAIEEYHDLKGWRQLRDQSQNATQEEAWYNKDYPSTLLPHRKDEGWCPMVVPRHDIFCIDMRRFETLPETLYGMKLLAPFISTQTFTIMESWNIALKFDESWNWEFPTSGYHHLKSEKTPRGLLANWLERFKDDIYPKPSLWIIDDSVGWSSPVAIPNPVYRDCDGEYVEIDLNDTCIDINKKSAASFMKSLGTLLNDNLPPYSFRVAEYLRLLVRKDNRKVRDLYGGFEWSDATQDDSEEDSLSEGDDEGDGSDIRGEQDE